LGIFWEGENLQVKRVVEGTYLCGLLSGASTSPGILPPGEKKTRERKTTPIQEQRGKKNKWYH